MKRALIVLGLATLLLVSSVAVAYANPWPGGPANGQMDELVSGPKFEQVGWVYTWKDSENFYVKYECNVNGGYIVETHLQLADDPSDVPQNNGNVAPGQFEYETMHYPGVRTYTYSIPLSELPEDPNFVVAAHAVVAFWGDYKNAETAWGTGCFSDMWKFSTKGNWFRFFRYYAESGIWF